MSSPLICIASWNRWLLTVEQFQTAMSSPTWIAKRLPELMMYWKVLKYGFQSARHHVKQDSFYCCRRRACDDSYCVLCFTILGTAHGQYPKPDKRDPVATDNRIILIKSGFLVQSHVLMVNFRFSASNKDIDMIWKSTMTMKDASWCSKDSIACLYACHEELLLLFLVSKEHRCR